GSSTAKTVEFEITKKELLSSTPTSSKTNSIGSAEWKFKDNTVTVEITDDRVSGETVSLAASYDVQGSTSSPIPLTAGMTTSGNVTTITMPDNIPVGKYTLYISLNGTSGDNGNYQITKNNTLDFEVTAAAVDPSNYTWIYTKDGAAGGTISDGDKLPFVLKTGSTVDGVKYELSIQIPSSDSVAVDTSKYANGYQLSSGDKVGTYKTVVALKSTDPTFQFEVNGVMQSTIDVELNWEIEKGTFDLSNVKWEYNLDGTSTWTDYDPANPPQYNDGNYITVRIKSTSLPLGLTLDSTYIGMEKANVENYTATISLSDLAYNTSNFNAPDVSTLTLNWEIAKKNLYTRFKNVSESYSNANYSGTFILKQLDVDASMAGYISYKYYDMTTGLKVTLADIKAAVDPTNEKNYKVEATIDPAYSKNYTVDDNGSTPSDTFTTGSQNELAKATVDGNDGKTAISVEYDGNTHFDSSVIAVKSDSGIVITDYTVVYYKGKSPVAGNELAAGDLPKDAGEYCIQIVLGSVAERRYILERDTFEIKIEAKGIAIPELGEMVFNGKELKFEDFLGGTWNDYKSIITLDGKLSDRNVGASSYVTTLTLTDSNYKWIYPTTSTPVKAMAKYSLTADGVTVTGDDTVATYNWNITPLVIDTTNLWNKSKNGATLNLPQNVRDLIAGGTLEVGYRYYDSDGTLLDDVELKAGRSFKVEAAFSGDDAERNVQFKTGETEYGSVSKSIDYTVPTSGAAAFLGNIKDFVSKTWLGLPIWAWMLIGLALLILLIIIIVVAC
ncbi:MAG: hypothetical protein K2N52_05815, partial [Clostridia bacterium]|nr:hypothetical protein [Clostridia bacterium]